MAGKGKELHDALQRLETCCPGSTRVSHMQTASTELHKALLDLDQARNQEQHLRKESDALLEGMNVIISSKSSRKAFKMVLEVLKGSLILMMPLSLGSKVMKLSLLWRAVLLYLKILFGLPGRCLSMFCPVIP